MKGVDMRKNIKIFIALILVYSIILIIKNQGTKTTITLPSEGERKSSYTQTYTVYNKQYYDIPQDEPLKTRLLYFDLKKD